MGKRDKKVKEAEAAPAWELARERIRKGALGYLMACTSVRREKPLARDSWAYVTAGGEIHLNPRREAAVGEWEYIICHCLLHLGLGHFQRERMADQDWHTACDCVVTKFLRDSRMGTEPPEFRQELPSAVKSEEQVWEWLRAGGKPRPALSTAGDRPDMVWQEDRWRDNYPEIFAESLQRSMQSALLASQGLAPDDDTGRTRRRRSQYEAVRDWFVDSYPLLGAVAASFRIVDDCAAVERMGIPVAAISPQMGELYMNPRCRLSTEEWRFVLAHEFLHAALRHDLRCEDREGDLWNVACDYVINAWLREMALGVMPEFALYDARFQGMSAEGVYDLLREDARRYRAENRGDVLYGDPACWDSLKDAELDELYRSALRRGLTYHQEHGRGYLPAGLVEEIYAVARPPIRWDVALARWFDERFTPAESRRTYARMSRRQSSTPDIPRPAWYREEEREAGQTFGVLLDTSGSMDRTLLAAALGAIASYSEARDVKLVRVVFCDAMPYDQGFMAPEDIAGAVQVRGWGGTKLQPGIDLLEEAPDFPKNAPLLIITDGLCDRLRLGGRDHAYLIPYGRCLPFPPKGPVFKLK